jgi:hypothetical protein
MASLKQAEIMRQLVSKFHFDELPPSRHRRFRLSRNDEILATVEVIHSKTDARDGLIASMAKQAGVNSFEFQKMINCTMSEDQFLSRLEEHRQQSEIPSSNDPAEIGAQKVPQKKRQRKH